MYTNEKIRSVGTLGADAEDVTCSVLAVKSLDGSFDLVAFSEFELAAQALLDGKIDAMVVPGAYPGIAKFIMHEGLQVAWVYTFIIPSLVFVSKHPTMKNEYRTLYNHPATNALLGDVHTRWNAHQNVSSNTVACLEVLANGSDSCAVTNAVCAQKYGLHIHKVLREGINMPFTVFTARTFQTQRSAS